MTERCPKCGSEARDRWEGHDQEALGHHLPVPRYECPLDPKDCRIAELEEKLAEADLREENILAVLPEDFSAVEYIEELERQLEKAKACAEDMKQRNAKLRQERVDYYNGSALEEVTAKYNALLVSYDTLAQKPGRELILEKEVKNYAARLHDESRKVYEARLERDEAQGKALELESERDAALAQVVALRAQLQCSGVHDLECKIDGCSCGLESILSNTSATAQQAVERIEREALEKAIERLLGHYSPACNSFFFERKELHAAILGEKGQG